MKHPRENLTLYHVDVFMPEQAHVLNVHRPHALVYTTHALDRAVQLDLIVEKPRTLSIKRDEAQLIEAQFYEGHCVGLLFRIPLFVDGQDLVLAVAPEFLPAYHRCPDLIVGTMWLNNHDDVHHSLDLSAYSKSYP